MRKTIFLIAMAGLLFGGPAHAQIPVELFGGHEKTTIDVMFFRYFKNKEGQNSKWLFFNRNRASMDYRQTATSFLPQFGFTEAVSYNHPALKGFAPVVVGQVLNRGVFPKAGVQWAKLGNDYTIFSWAVVELLKSPNLDFFLLARYTPKLTKDWRLFTQLELVNAFPTAVADSFTFTQRLRLGLKIRIWQFGAGADFSTTGRGDYVLTKNLGGFLRVEF